MINFEPHLALPFGHPLICDDCDSQMTLTLALTVIKGGLMKHGHDKHRATVAKLVKNVIGVEPILRKENLTNNVPALYADCMVKPRGQRFSITPL